MERYTEYHEGKAVIRDKSLLPEAMAKLAKYEDEEEKKIIERLESTNWIPVDERLPDPDELILVSFFNFSLPMIGRYTVDDDDGGTFRVGDEDDSFVVEHDLYVNAWMPLPEPYKEG